MESSLADHHHIHYGFDFSVYKNPQDNLHPKVEEECDDEFTYTTVLMRLWKMRDESDAYEQAGSRECRIWQDEVAVEEERPTLTLKTQLTELGIVPERAQLEAIELVLERVCMEDVIGKTGMWVVMDIAERWYEEEADMDEKVGMVPASEAAIAGLDKFNKVEEGDARLSYCAICTEEDEERFSRMPCTHVFHTECVEKWLRISSSCPICRYEMPVD